MKHLAWILLSLILITSAVAHLPVAWQRTYQIPWEMDSAAPPTWGFCDRRRVLLHVARTECGWDGTLDRH